MYSVLLSVPSNAGKCWKRFVCLCCFTAFEWTALRYFIAGDFEASTALDCKAEMLQDRPNLRLMLQPTKVHTAHCVTPLVLPTSIV